MTNRKLHDHLSIFELADRDRSWFVDAACRGTHNALNFFPSKMGERGVKETIAICDTCTVRARCLTFAINNNINHGIWGGMTARARRELANAMAYINDPTRAEHTTARWYRFYNDTGDRDPLRRTAQTLGMSKATVYHHLRIDRLSKETLDAHQPDIDQQ